MRGRFLKFGLPLSIFIFGVSLFAASASWAQKKFYYDWTAPPEFVSLKNPFSENAGAAAAGEGIYKKWCLRCHGKNGNGEGTSSASLMVAPGDLADKKRMRPQSDGALLWKIRIGRGEMPPWQLVLKDEEIWKAIKYIRKFSK